MSDRKVFYPVKDVTLCGILNDVHVTLCGFSDIWAFREHASIQSGFLLATQMVILGALKEIELKGGISLYAEDVAVVSTKNVKDLSADLVLDVLMATALRKTIELQGGLAISNDVEYSVRRWLDAMRVELMLGGEVESSFMARGIELSEGICIKPEFGALDKSIEMRCEALGLAVGAELELRMPKSLGTASSGISLGAVVDAVARRFREMENLDGLTFADLEGWTMHKFYYVEG